MIKNKSIALLIAICFIVIIFCIGAYNDTSLYWYFPHEVGIFIANPSSELHVAGTTPEVRIGDDDAEDTSLIFMGNAKDMYIALDDTTDDLTIGEGTTIGSNVRMVIENSGNVGFGTIIPQKNVDIVDQADSSVLRIIAFSNTATHSGRLQLGHTRGTELVQTAIQSGDELGSILAGGFDTNLAFQEVIKFMADGEWGTASDSTDSPTRISFCVTPDGSGSSNEALRLQSDGDIIHHGSYNYGSDTGSTDDYAITFTPALTEYIVGLVVYFKANTANDGACSLNINGLGTKALKSLHNQDPAANYIEAGSVVHCIYQDTNVFQILSPDANP